MAGFDIQGAKAAGYSDAEIADFMKAQNLQPAAAPSLGRRAWDAVKSAGGEVADFTHRANEYKDTQIGKAIGGLGGLPRTTADAIGYLEKKTGIPLGLDPIFGSVKAIGSQMPTSDEVYNAVRMPNVQGSGIQPERSISPIVDAGIQGLLTGPALGVGGRFGPLVNFGGGATSEAAGEIAHEHFPKWETPARIFGALVGGGGAAGAAALGGKLGRTASALVRPFTAEGRDALAARALNQTASNPQTAAANIEGYLAGQRAYPQNVPGFQINAGQAARDPGLMAAAETIPQARRGAIANENNAKLTAAFGNLSGGLPTNPGGVIQNELGKTVEGLKGVRALETEPLYEAAKRNPTPVKPFPLMTFTADALDQTKGAPHQTMKEARSLLFTQDKNGRTIPDRSANGMIATDKAIGAMLEREGLDTESRNLLLEMKRRTEAALDVVPPALQAKRRYAELSRPLDPFNPDLGDVNKTLGNIVARDKYNKGYLMSDEKVPGKLMQPGPMSAPMVQHLLDASGGNPAVKRAMQAAYINDFRRAASSPVAEAAPGEPRLTAVGASNWMEKHRAGASLVLTPEQRAAMDEITQHLTNAAQVPPARTGSPTYDRLATQSIISAALTPNISKVPFMHGVNKALGLAYGGADEAVKSRLFEALQDPALARMLMLKATPQNVRLAEPVLGKLLAPAATSINRSDERAAP